MAALLKSREKTEQLDYAPIIGIDLGTTRSCIAFWSSNRKRVKVISDYNTGVIYKAKTTPSVIGFQFPTPEECNRNKFFELDEEEKKEALHTFVGDVVINPKSAHKFDDSLIISNVKRIIGSKFSNKFVQDTLQYLPFDVVCSGSNDEPLISTPVPKNLLTSAHNDGSELNLYFAPEELSAIVLQHLKSIAEHYLKCKITKAVITIPAHFNATQRTATKEAAKQAGLEVLRLLAEPSAAAMAYGIQQTGDKSKIVLTYDLGGGTLDVSLMKIVKGNFHVLSTAGNSILGGEDFNNQLLSNIKLLLQKSIPNQTFSNSKQILSLQNTVCEKLKCELSNNSAVAIQFPYCLKADDKIDGTKISYFSITVTANQLEEWCSNLFKQCFDPINTVLEDAKMTPNDVDEIICVGGSTRMPKIRSLLKEYFKKEICYSVNPDEAIAQGAAIQAAMLDENVNSALLEECLIFDIVPHSIGIENIDGSMEVIIKRNSSIPTVNKIILKNSKANQRAVTIRLFEGEDTLVCNNKLLQDFEFPIRNYNDTKVGEREVEITLSMNSSGLISVTAETLHVPTASILNVGGLIILLIWSFIVLVAFVYNYQAIFGANHNVNGPAPFCVNKNCNGLL